MIKAKPKTAGVLVSDAHREIASPVVRASVEAFREAARMQRDDGWNDRHTMVNQHDQALRWASIYDAIALRLEKGRKSGSDAP